MSPTKALTAAIYARVSTEDQKYDMQLTELRQYADRAGWRVVEYTEKMSSRKKRPVFDRMMGDARMRKFDVVLVWKLDRFARSMKDFVETALTLAQSGVRFLAPNQGIDTDMQTPTGKFLMHILAAFAELERDMIVERVNSGVQQYRVDYEAGRIGKTKHSKSGKDLAHGRPRRIFRRDEALELRAAGFSLRKIATKLGVPVTTIVRNLGSVPKTSA